MVRWLARLGSPPDGEKDDGMKRLLSALGRVQLPQTETTVDWLVNELQRDTTRAGQSKWARLLRRSVEEIRQLRTFSFRGNFR
jgi:hypothetical protein